MNTFVEIVTAPGVSLEQMLVAREDRAARQSAALARFGQPLVSISVVMPGPMKDGSLPRHVLEVAQQLITALARRRKWPVLSGEVRRPETGPEAIYVIAVKPVVLKAATVEMEDEHPLGRLWDLDVIAPGQGKLSRRALALPARCCLVCDKPAFECGRSRRHPLDELLNTVRSIVHKYDQCRGTGGNRGNRVCMGDARS